MSPKPPRPRRRLGHGGLSLLVLAASSSLLWSASSGTASAVPLVPTPVCADGTCTVTFAATGAVQAWTVPAGVTSLEANVAGAAGGGASTSSAGGLGGRTNGTLTVKPGDALAVVVGSAGEASTDDTDGAAGTFGGGGAGGDNLLDNGGGTSGGGASYVFGSDLLLAAGGGGGASGARAGGAGGGAEAAAGAGSAGPGSTGGLPGIADANGAGGETGGGAGSGDTTDASTLATGGQGGAFDSIFSSIDGLAGGGGGGGFHAGGGGGGVFDANGPFDSGSGGGGGAGFAAEGVADVVGTAGVTVGDGVVTLSYADLPAYTVSFTSSFDGAVVGAKTRNVSAEASSPERVTFSVDPATTSSACTVAGSTVTFAHVGTCVIAGDVPGDATHAPGHNVLSFDIAQGNQTITFAPLPATGEIGDVIPLEATSTPGSGSPVVFSTGAGSGEGVCTVDDAAKTVTLAAVGRCVVLAAQAGTVDYKAANTINHEIAVSLIATTTALTFDVPTPVYGQPVTASVVVTGTSTSGFVQFSVDGQPLGDRVSVVDGQAKLTLPDDLGAGGHPVKAVFTPTGSTYAASSDEQSLPVAKATTSTDLTVRANQASVVVSALAPGSGTPGGTVVFSFGDTVSAPVPVVRGKATYDSPVPAETVISVVYSGDDDFAGSSTSSLRRNPTIEATVTSDAVKSRAGWYRKPVTVTFTCHEGSAALSDDCPDPVTLSTDGASQGVTRTITATDGGIATVSVTGINVDTTAPAVSALDVQEGDRFFSSAPDAGCLATDDLSGVAACSSHREVDGKEVTYSVIAMDQAGNVTTEEVHATTYNRGIVDVPYVDGAYVVKAGQTVTLVAKSSKRPQLYKPVEAPKKPSKSGDKFKASGDDDEWALGYTIPTSLKAGKTYNLGIKTTSRYTIKITVIA